MKKIWDKFLGLFKSKKPVCKRCPYLETAYNRWLCYHKDSNQACKSGIIYRTICGNKKVKTSPSWCPRRK